ncbi:ABC transporter permease [Ferrimicrobium sp.]|uniref:ABC transporter permease n=1 Tax=Ferrimicrobium sp. TaxID=2926050 RepID=UPI002632250E|nr:ABC transporter permease [Ferrimicrobium sp.]
MITADRELSHYKRPSMIHVLGVALTKESRLLYFFIAAVICEGAWWTFADLALRHVQIIRVGSSSGFTSATSAANPQLVALASVFSTPIALLVPLLIPVISLAPRIAGVFDRKTGTFLFTQGVTRRGWLTVHLLAALVATAILTLISALCYRTIVLPRDGGATAPYWHHFLIFGPEAIGLALAVTALSCAGALLIRSLGTAAFVSILIGLVLLFGGTALYPNLVSPSVVKGPMIVTGAAARRLETQRGGAVIQSSGPPVSGQVAESQSKAALPDWTFNSFSVPQSGDLVGVTNLLGGHVIGNSALNTLETRCLGMNYQAKFLSHKPACDSFKTVQEELFYVPASKFGELQWLVFAILAAAGVIVTWASIEYVDRISL